ncbi:MAG: cohesin domain-containing protein, partial [Candidatus Poribacteria bacterium]|nr:cohesin domain-containing protein [Candidatus Poribacteria bacterium]
SPQDGDIGVPTEIYLQLQFDQEMNPGSVLDSVLRLSQLEVDGITVVNQFDLPLNSVAATDLIQVEWSNNNQTLTVNTKAFKLETSTTYRVEMVENRAKGANGLPLRLGYPVDLSQGITFTTAIEARTTEEVSVPIGIPTPITGVAVNIPQGTEISVPMDIHFSAEVAVLTSLGQIESRNFESEDGLLEGSMFVTLPPNTAFTVTEKYDGQAVPDTIFPLPTYDFGLPNRQNEFNTGSSTENIIYQINLRAELSDLLTMVLGDFNGTARIKETLTDVVNLELTATKDIPANTDINFASGFTIDLSRTMQVEQFVPCTLSVDLDASTDVYVDEAISKGLNQTISVAIVVTDAEDLDSYSFTLKYAPGKMRLIPGSIQQGGFLGDTAYFIPSVDQENGRISISQSLFNSEADFGQSGNGRLAVLEFEIVDAGQIDLSIDPTDAVVFNSARDQFSPLLEDATITVDRPDPTVNLQIEHQVVTSRTEYAGFLADPTTQILPDDIIKIKVTADYLTNLDSYDLNLSYNTNILEPVTDGEALLFFDETGSVISTANQDENTFTIYTIDQNTGQVQVSRSISGSDPIGAPDGFFQLFELRLKAIQGGVGQVKLDQLQLIDVQNRIDSPSLATAT